MALLKEKRNLLQRTAQYTFLFYLKLSRLAFRREISAHLFICNAGSNGIAGSYKLAFSATVITPAHIAQPGETLRLGWSEVLATSKQRFILGTSDDMGHAFTDLSEMTKREKERNDGNKVSAQSMVAMVNFDYCNHCSLFYVTCFGTGFTRGRTSNRNGLQHNFP